MADLSELRRILDCAAAEMAAHRRQPRDLEQMQAALDAMTAALEDDDAQRFIDSDLRFHIAMADATGNSLVSHTLDAIRDVLRDALLEIFRIPESAERAIDEHRAILAAIQAGDGTEARIAARIHLDRVEADVHGNE